MTLYAFNNNIARTVAGDKNSSLTKLKALTPCDVQTTLDAQTLDVIGSVSVSELIERVL